LIPTLYHVPPVLLIAPSSALPYMTIPRPYHIMLGDR
jgi:hypothetical protein